MTVVAVMARALDAPADTVKTRLAPLLPRAADRLALHTALLADVMAAARGVTDARVRVASTPDGQADSFRAVDVEPGHVFLQRGDDLGARERGVFEHLFRQGARQVVLIGSDIPTITTTILQEACAALRTTPGHVVIGPAADGGYYLLGVSGPPVPDLFSGVRWSTSYTLADTLRRCEFENLRVSLLPVLEDVDTPDTLARLRETLAADPARAPHTAQALHALLSTPDESRATPNARC